MLLIFMCDSFNLLIIVFVAVECVTEQSVTADSSIVFLCFCLEKASSHNTRTMYDGRGGGARGRVSAGVRKCTHTHI